MSNLNEEELRLLNTYTRRTLTAEEVYVFSVTLCDNEVDRDFERFSVPALHALAPLFLGKSGIFDHNRSAEGQTARIFKTWVEEDANRKTSQGEPYTMLRARAYMMRTEENRSLIDDIDGGIKKEVSVGCSLARSICSICGGEQHTNPCEHRPGRRYGKQLCHRILDDPKDAYEWSFVAVPAQRGAGVTKAFFKKEEPALNDTLQRVKSADGGLTLTEKDVQTLKAQIDVLEKEQAQTAVFRKQLLSDIEKYLLLALPQMKTKVFLEGCSAMDADALLELRKTLKAQAAAALPPTVQLRHTVTNKPDDRNNRAFCI